MYTQQHCNQPNSSDPPTAADTARQVTVLNWAQNAFDNGDAALNDLITTLHGNAPGVAAVGNAGVPTGYTPAPPGSPSAGWIPRPGLNRLFPDWAYGPRSGFVPYPITQACQRPVVVETVLRAASTATQPAMPAPAPGKSAPVSTPAVIADCTVTPDNICQMIRDGCVLSSQVSLEQLQACSAAGWAGNRNLYPAIAARGGSQNGKYFGALNLNPPRANGLNGLGAGFGVVNDAPSFGSMAIMLLGLTALAGAGVWALNRVR